MSDIVLTAQTAPVHHPMDCFYGKHEPEGASVTYVTRPVFFCKHCKALYGGESTIEPRIKPVFPHKTDCGCHECDIARG